METSFKFGAADAGEGGGAEEEGFAKIEAFGGEIFQGKHDVFGLLEGVFVLEAAVADEADRGVFDGFDLFEGDSLVFDHEDADVGVEEDEVGARDVAAWGESFDVEGCVRGVEGLKCGEEEACVLGLLDVADAGDVGFAFIAGDEALEFCDIVCVWV